MDLTKASPPVPNSAPGRVAGFAPPSEEALFTPVSAGNGAPAIVQPLPPGAPFLFAVRLAGASRASVSNAVSAKLTSAIIAALAAKEIVVPPAALVVTSISEVKAPDGVLVSLAIDTAQVS